MRRSIALAPLLLAAGCGDAPPRAAEPRRATPEFRAERTEEVAARPSGRYLVARVQRRTLLRARPRGRTLAKLGRRTEFGSPRVLGVLRRRGGWLKVLVSELPNGESGWIPARSTRVYGTDFSIRVDRSARRLTLRRDARVVHRMRIAVGRPDTPTPLGRFAVTDRLRPNRADSPYGCCLLALSGHQTKLLPGWVGGDRLAIHATPSTWTIGKQASLGCMRGFARDVRTLMRRVPLGTPVFIRA